MTKIATATAALQLIEQRQLSLDDLVERHVPGLLPPPARPTVRVRHLLQHTSGLPNPPPIRWVRPADQPAPPPRQFLERRFTRIRRLRFQPGSRASYTNLGYLLLGEVIATAAGQPFIDYVQAEILDPLGMHHSAFSYASTMAGRATGHQRGLPSIGLLLHAALPRGVVNGRHGPWVRFQPFLVNGAPYGGLVGSVTDAARLLALHANGGIFGETRLLSDGSTHTMQAITISGSPFDHGLGWFRPTRDRHRQPSFIEHYGGGGGFYNLMRLYPTLRIGTVLMGNSTKYDIETTADRLAEIWTT